MVGDRKECQFCKATYKDTSALNRHLKTKHPDEWKKLKEPKMAELYKCPICPKAFINKMKRKAHVATHSKE